ncbi:uncharacterized protein LOC144126926 [Amblyomma americanum]
MHDLPVNWKHELSEFWSGGVLLAFPDFPRFHVVHSEHEEQTARQVSPFIVTRTLTSAIGEGYKIKTLANGDLLLEVLYNHQQEKLSEVKSFGDIPVIISTHRSLNTVRGVISDDDLKYVTDEELLEGLKEQNVTNVYRIKIRRDNEEIPTKQIALTFAFSILPDSVEIGYIKLQLRQYIPNPRRCFKCQRYGHSSQSCRGQLTCAKCSFHEHDAENCAVEPHLCVNCEGSHPAYSRACPVWKQEKEIVTIKVKENITFREARKRVASIHKPTFSDVVQRGTAPQPLLAPTQATRSEPVAGPPVPKVAAASAAPPPTKQDARASRSAGPKVPPHTERPNMKTNVRLARSSSVSEDAMDTMDTSQSSPKASTSKGRRGSIDRKKRKAPNKGA